MEEITNLQYEEKGLLSKKGVLLILTRTQDHEFVGKTEDVKIIWKEMQQHLGYNEPFGAPTVYTNPKEQEDHISENWVLPNPADEELKILKMRYTKGEISRQEYEETKRSLEED